MGLTQQDRETIALIAGEVVERVMASHIQSCPHGQRLANRMAFIAGVVTTVSVVTGVLGFVIGLLVK